MKTADDFILSILVNIKYNNCQSIYYEVSMLFVSTFITITDIVGCGF